MNPNIFSGQVVDAAMTVHTALGPGLLESAYEACLAHELEKRGLRVQRQAALPVVYDGVRIDIGYRLDLLVEDAVVVELKAVDKLTPLHEAQLLSYLKLSGLEVGLLINFHVPRLKDGIKRMVNRLGRESLESTGRDISTPRLSAASAVKLPIARSDHAD